MTKIKVAGPPGTGKTTYLVERYYDAIQKYSAADIVVISHTNTAADHIRDEINNTKNIDNYYKETGKNVLKLIQESKKVLKLNVSTIHKYCKDQLKGSDVFDISDFELLKQHYPIFNRHTANRKYGYIEGLLKGHPFFKFIGFSRDNGKEPTPYYRSLSYEDKKDYKYSIQELIDMNDLYIKYKTDPVLNQGRTEVLDFQDMIKSFTKLPKDPVIKVLMVDEAQDSSALQRAAEEKMARNCDLFYKAGDPDQSIFEFAGADPHNFHLEFAHPEVELDLGYRCPRKINEWCKEVINPIWKHYKYSRTWKPREELDKDGKRNGVVVEGEIYPLMNLKQDPNLHLLIDKLLNTRDTFIFTHRSGEPYEIIEFLRKHNLPYKFIKRYEKLEKSYFYPKQEVELQREYLTFSKGEPKKWNICKKLLTGISSEYHGPRNNVENIEKLIRKSYTIDDLIQQQFLLPIIKKTSDYQELTENDLKIKTYIRNIVNNNRDLQDITISVANIHTVKGREFNHVILDLTLTREEQSDFSKRRIKFVAGSRARDTLWLIKSKGLSL